MGTIKSADAAEASLPPAALMVRGKLPNYRPGKSGNKERAPRPSFQRNPITSEAELPTSGVQRPSLYRHASAAAPQMKSAPPNSQLSLAARSPPLPAGTRHAVSPSAPVFSLFSFPFSPPPFLLFSFFSSLLFYFSFLFMLCFLVLSLRYHNPKRDSRLAPPAELLGKKTLLGDHPRGLPTAARPF